MPRAEAGSAKAIGNAMKAKGLTKLRFYCQLCQKACRDENGYKCHIESEAHMRQMSVLGNNAGKVIDNFSQEFQGDFMQLLSRRFGTRRVRANAVYQELIQERHHLHLNATRWTSLSSFVKHLGREGLVRVDETEKGFFVEWVDNSPAALQRQDALQKMNRAKIDEETRMRKHLNEQIERAKREGKEAGAEQAATAQPQKEGLKRDGGAPIKIGISFKPKPSAEAESSSAAVAGSSTGAGTAAAAESAARSTSTAAPASAPAAAPFKFGAANPLKAPVKLSNAFKSSSSGASSKASSSGAKPSMTAAERIMAEEQERKRKKDCFGPQPSAKRLRM